MKWMKLVVTISIILAATLNYSLAQEIKANVIVNMDQLNQEYRFDVSALENDVENYINTQKFTDVEWEGDPIPIDVTIYLSGGYQKKYSAQMIIAAKRYIYGTDKGQTVTLLLKEDNWTFEYSRGAMYTFNANRFNEFSTIIDFYMLLIIGHDMDTYGSLDGSKVLDKCQRLASMASNSAPKAFDVRAQRGEMTKYNLIREMTDMTYETFRKLIFQYYVDGLDYMAEDEENALATIAFIINDMARFKEDKLSGPSTFLQVFFESKARELASLFEGYENKSVFKDLMYLDPSNSLIYTESRDK